MALESEGYPRAEEALRLLSSALSTARLYPAASDLPREAAEQFTRRVNELTTHGPLRLRIDPHGFRIADMEIAPENNQLTSFAETLHALQVGQLVLAPDITMAETQSFVHVATSDAAQVRAAQGPRAMLISLGVSHIAVIEVSLRASDEGGLLGLDLAQAPLDSIAFEVAAAAERRAQAASAGPADDEVAEAIGRLETATRDIALDRIAAAMMLLDEQTRQRILSIALTSDSVGTRMEGMLTAICRMKPAALARLIRLLAANTGTQPSRIAATMPVPPRVAELLARLLAPGLDLDPDLGIDEDVQATSLAAELSVASDPTELRRQVANASPALAAGRALSTAVSISRRRVDTETVASIGEVLAQAARNGSFPAVREALRRLDEIARDPALSSAVFVARSALVDKDVLSEVCQTASTESDAAIAGEILQAAGPVGAEVLLDHLIHAPEPTKSLFQPVLRTMAEPVLGAARPRFRTSDTATASGVVRVLTALGDQRAVPLLTQVLEDHLDEQVRFAAASSLASMQGEGAIAALIKSIGHREPETQRFVVRKIGELKVGQAVGPLSRTFDDITSLSPTYETRKEIISSLGAIGTPEAEKFLRKVANRRLRFGRKNRELKRRARCAVDEMEREDQGVDAS